MEISDFARGSEKLIDPIQVGKVHYAQKWAAKLPKWLQRKLVTREGKRADKMGFVVEPYAFFLCYEVSDPEVTEKLLPDGFRLVKASCFTGDEPKTLGIVSIFRLHTSAFWGARAEFYVMAENVKTGLVSWVILDYVSDTISYDHKFGLRSAQAKRAVVTTTCEGRLLTEIEKSDDGRRLICEANLQHYQMKPLDERTWIEGNTSIAYGRDLSDGDGKLFSLTFLPQEMTEAWEIPLADVKVEAIEWFPEVFAGKLVSAACFPYAQHMLSDSPGNSTHYGSRESLQRAAEAVDFERVKRYTEK